MRPTEKAIRDFCGHHADWWPSTTQVQEMLALAQPEQEPVGWEHHEYRPYGGPGQIRIHAVLASQYMLPDGSVAGDFQWLVDQYKADKNTIKLIPLYTTPTQRKWVGLTDDEMTEIVTDIDVDWGDLLWKVVCLTKIIEAKLKERNNG